MIGSWPQPQVVQPGFLTRVVVLRFCLVWLCIRNLDAALTTHADSGSRWDWGTRVGMVGMFLPLLLNMTGLLWPFLQLSTFEASYQDYHQAITYGSILGKLMEQLSGTGVAASGCQQSMLVQGLLFIVHQDPVQQFLPPLAVMLAAYAVCHLCCGSGALLRSMTSGSSSRTVAATAGLGSRISSSTPGAYIDMAVSSLQQQGDSLGNQPLAITTAGEFFVNTFMLLLLLHHLYCTYMGPREQEPRAGLTPSDNQGSSHRNTSRPSTQHTGSQQTTAVSTNGHTRKGSSNRLATCGPRLSRAYLLKLAVVKGTNACFLAIYALHSWRQARSGQQQVLLQDSGTPATWVRLHSLGLQPHVVGLVCSSILLAHAACGFCFPHCFKQHMSAINALSFYCCLAARCYLVWSHGWAGRACSSCNGSSGSTAGIALAPDHAFHTFLMLAFSLSVNEDPPPLFAAQLTALALMCRWLHGQLLGCSSAQPAAPAMSKLQLPEYFLVTTVIMVVYKWLCVGKSDQQQEDSAGRVPGYNGRKRPGQRAARSNRPRSKSLPLTSSSKWVAEAWQAGLGWDSSRQQWAFRRSSFSTGSDAHHQRLAAAAAAAGWPVPILPLSHESSEPCGGGTCKGPSSTARDGAKSPSAAAAAAQGGNRGQHNRRLPSVDIRFLAKASFELAMPSSPSVSSGEQLVGLPFKAYEQLQGADGQQQQQHHHHHHQQEGQCQDPAKMQRSKHPATTLQGNNTGLHLLSSLYSLETVPVRAMAPAQNSSSGSACSPTFPPPTQSAALAAFAPPAAMPLASIAEGSASAMSPRVHCPSEPLWDTADDRDVTRKPGVSSVWHPGQQQRYTPDAGVEPIALKAHNVATGTASVCHVAATAGHDSPLSDEGSAAHHMQSQAPSRELHPLDASPQLTDTLAQQAPHFRRSSFHRSDFSSNSSKGQQGVMSSSNGLVQDVEALAKEPCSRVRQWQRLGCETMMCMLELPLALARGLPLLLRALRASSEVDAVCRLLGAAGALLYLAGWLTHLLYLVLRPSAALQQRKLLWPLRVCLAPSVLRVLQMVLQVEVPWKARRGLLLQAMGMGLLDLPVHLFAAWLPLMVVVYFSTHAWAAWPERSWAMLAVDAAEYNLYPVVIYAASKLSVAALQGALVVVVPRLRFMLQAWRSSNPCSGSPAVQHSSPAGRSDDGLVPKQQKGRHPQRQHLRGRVTSEELLVGCAAAVGQLLVSLLLMALILWAPAMWPEGTLPLAAVESSKTLLSGMFLRMDLHILNQTNQETLQVLAALLGIALSFLAVSGLQAMLLSSAAFQDPRNRAYQAAKAQVFTLGERTMTGLAMLDEGAGVAEVDAVLLSTLQEVTFGCFPECSLLLVLLEEASLHSGAAQRHVIQATPDARNLPKCTTMPLSALPSIEAACKERHVIFKSDVANSAAGYSDWEELAGHFGMTAFLVVPLYFAHRNLGALVVTSKSPAALDKYLRKLAVELSFALSQVLYTRLCIEQLHAGDEIIHDVLPEKVAEHLRRRVISARSSIVPLATSVASDQQLLPTGIRRESPHQGLLVRLSEAATALRVQQQQLQQQHEGIPVGQRSSVSDPDGAVCSSTAVGVAYKQWHKQVSVLFADIVGYTALSHEVEPEQVMMLLHELFSKYDHLCKCYGIYKVETIGDCYMACCGVLVENHDHARHMVQFGRAMLAAAASVKNPTGGSVRVRVGIHSGRVMSGIVGNIRARYCLFGDTVNTASRMESTGIEDRIQISEDTHQLIGDLQSDFELRESVPVKGKGLMRTFVLKEPIAEQLRAQGLAHASDPPAVDAL